MFLDEFSKELQHKFLMRNFVAGWQNKPGPIDIMVIGTEPGMVGTSINRKPLSTSHSGKLFWKIVKDTGWKDKTIYITNLIKYPLLNSRDPTEVEIAENMPLLEQEIMKYKPALVLCLGKHSMIMFSLRTYSSRIVGNHTIAAINHPGYYLRKPAHIKDAVNFLKSIEITEKNL